MVIKFTVSPEKVGQVPTRGARDGRTLQDSTTTPFQKSLTVVDMLLISLEVALRATFMLDPAEGFRS